LDKDSVEGSQTRNRRFIGGIANHILYRRTDIDSDLPIQQNKDYGAQKSNNENYFETVQDDFPDKRYLDGIGSSLLRKRYLDGIGSSLIRKRYVDDMISGLIPTVHTNNADSVLSNIPYLDGIGSGLANKRYLDGIGSSLLHKRYLDGIGSSLLHKRYLDGIGSSLLHKRYLDGIGSSLLHKRYLDGIGSSLIRKRYLDGIGSSLIRKRYLDGIGSSLLQKRYLDSLGSSLIQKKFLDDVASDIDLESENKSLEKRQYLDSVGSSLIIRSPNNIDSTYNPSNTNNYDQVQSFPVSSTWNSPVKRFTLSEAYQPREMGTRDLRRLRAPSPFFLYNSDLTKVRNKGSETSFREHMKRPSAGTLWKGRPQSYRFSRLSSIIKGSRSKLRNNRSSGFDQLEDETFGKLKNNRPSSLYNPLHGNDGGRISTRLSSFVDRPIRNRDFFDSLAGGIIT